MEIELQDDGAIFDEVLLEIVDEVVAPRPDLFGDEVVDTDDEDVFIVRPIEDDDLASPRRMLMCTPQEVVRGLFAGRHLEAVHARPLRVHCAEDVIDRSVFARAVEPLEADEERTSVLSVQ